MFFYLLFHWWFFVGYVQSDFLRELKINSTFKLITTDGHFNMFSVWSSKAAEALLWPILILNTQKVETFRVIQPSRSAILHSPFLSFSLSTALRWTCATFLKLIWIETADIQFYHLWGEDIEQAWKCGSTFMLSSSIFISIWGASSIKKCSKFSPLTEHFEFGPTGTY